MKYVSKVNADVVVKAEKVKKDTTITTAEYGEILVAKGNYILTHVGKDFKGQQISISANQLEVYYEPVK